MSETVTPIVKKAKVQVLVFGHPLSRSTEKWLKSQYHTVRVHKVLIHVENWSGVIDEVERVIEALQAQGADLTGRTETLMAVPGSSVSTATLVAALAGALGKLPGILNLIRFPEGHYAPSPELPVIDLEQVEGQLGRKARRSFMNELEVLADEASVEGAVA